MTAPATSAFGPTQMAQVQDLQARFRRDADATTTRMQDMMARVDASVSAGQKCALATIAAAFLLRLPMVATRFKLAADTAKVISNTLIAFTAANWVVHNFMISKSSDFIRQEAKAIQDEMEALEGEMKGFHVAELAEGDVDVAALSAKIENLEARVGRRDATIAQLQEAAAAGSTESSDTSNAAIASLTEENAALKARLESMTTGVASTAADMAANNPKQAQAFAAMLPARKLAEYFSTTIASKDEEEIAELAALLNTMKPARVAEMVGTMQSRQTAFFIAANYAKVDEAVKMKVPGQFHGQFQEIEHAPVAAALANFWAGKLHAEGIHPKEGQSHQVLAEIYTSQLALAAGFKFEGLPEQTAAALQAGMKNLETFHFRSGVGRQFTPHIEAFQTFMKEHSEKKAVFAGYREGFIAKLKEGDNGIAEERFEATETRKAAPAQQQQGGAHTSFAGAARGVMAVNRFGQMGGHHGPMHGAHPATAMHGQFPGQFPGHGQR